MKRAGWMATAVAGLGLTSASALAQQGEGFAEGRGPSEFAAVWRPVIRASAHTDGPPARSGARAVPALPSGAGASLGAPRSREPIAVGDAALAYHDPPSAPPIASGGPARPGEVIASTHPPEREAPPEGRTVAPPTRTLVPASYPEDEGLFAGDRGPPIMLPPPAVVEGAPIPGVPGADTVPGPLGDWKTLQPVGPPPPGPLMVAPFGESVLPSRFFVSAEYLLWWAKQDRVPPLVTTGDPADGAATGALGRPATTILFDGRLDRDPRSGARFTAGLWLDDCMAHALEVSGFFLGSRGARFDATAPVLTRPFFDLNNNRETVERVAFPGVSTGRVRIDAPSQLWGLEANYKCKVCCGKDWRVNAFAGFRYLDLDESITIREDLSILANLMPSPGNSIPAGTQISAFDTFQTRNRFYGGQVGAEGRWLFGRVTLDVKGKLALGVTDQEVRIDGQQVLNLPDGTVRTFRGGLLAIDGANIGNFSRTAFSVVPEVGVNVGYFLTPNLRAYVGYNFLYWSNVLRPGDQIDRGLDITRIPNFAVPPGTVPLAGTPRPAVPFRDTDFWAQGLVVGMELTW